MLAMSTRQFRDPITRFILVKSDDRPARGIVIAVNSARHFTFFLQDACRGLARVALLAYQEWRLPAPRR